jgi:CDP-diacylglycerol--serine O-phosphatidyltransferase
MKKNAGNFVSWGSVLVVFISILTANPLFIVLGILIASLMDMFDGKLARKYGDNTDYSRTFGELTDSLCDVINFGVTPSLLLTIVIFEGTYPSLLIASSFLFTMASIFRLARFSATNTHKKIEYYQGLPITVAGPVLAVISIVFPSEFIIFTASIILALAMVSNLKVKKL